MAHPLKQVFVCAQQRPSGHSLGCCIGKGGALVLQSFWAELEKRNVYDRVAVSYSGCLGPCDSGVNVVVYPDGVLYYNVTPEDVGEIFDQHLLVERTVVRQVAPAEVW